MGLEGQIAMVTGGARSVGREHALLFTPAPLTT